MELNEQFLTLLFSMFAVGVVVFMAIESIRPSPSTIADRVLPYGIAFLIIVPIFNSRLDWASMLAIFVVQWLGSLVGVALAKTLQKNEG
jgi:glycerol uptake facilitator-like aquaporin